MADNLSAVCHLLYNCLQDKLFLAAHKHVASGTARPGSSLFSVAAANVKVAEEIAKMGNKIRELFNPFVSYPLLQHTYFYSTLLGVQSWVRFCQQEFG